MKLRTTQEPNQCKNCAGYGIFVYDSRSKWDLQVACPDCGSIHPEVLGLTYLKSELSSGVVNHRFYVVKPWWQFFS